jgi:hypothetical protein
VPPIASSKSNQSLTPPFDECPGALAVLHALQERLVVALGQPEHQRIGREARLAPDLLQDVARRLLEENAVALADGERERRRREVELDVVAVAADAAIRHASHHELDDPRRRLLGVDEGEPAHLPEQRVGVVERRVEQQADAPRRDGVHRLAAIGCVDGEIVANPGQADS